MPVSDSIADAETLREIASSSYVTNPRRHLVSRVPQNLSGVLFFHGWERYRTDWRDDLTDIYTPIRSAANAAFRAVPGLKGEANG